jgi:hypothetical protein
MNKQNEPQIETNEQNEPRFEIIEEIAVISTMAKGTKELNRVSWNGRPARLEIRLWTKGHEKARRGTTLTDNEALSLMYALMKYFDKHTVQRLAQ